MKHDDGRPGSHVPVLRLRAVATIGRMYLGALKRTSPALYQFLRAKRPQLRMRWGRTEWHIRRDGLVRITRPTDGDTSASPGADAEDHPGQNAGVPFIGRRAGEQDADPYLFRTPQEGVEGVEVEANVDLAEQKLRAEVERRMGKNPDAEEKDLEIPEELRNHEALAAEIARVRDLLQGLDDVEDFELIQELSDDLYHLHKAVDYKIKLHHSSEAKAELGKLFKM
jgi:hypothetical protein